MKLGGKYLVVRRDGTQPDWDYLVLGARDPYAPYGLAAVAEAVLDRAKALEKEHGKSPLPAQAYKVKALRDYAQALTEKAVDWENYRQAAGASEPEEPSAVKEDSAILHALSGGTSVVVVFGTKDGPKPQKD